VCDCSYCLSMVKGFSILEQSQWQLSRYPTHKDPAATWFCGCVVAPSLELVVDLWP
jgi:hypothetical protein